MKKLYEYYYYRVYLFHKKNIPYYLDTSQSGAIGNIAIWEMLNFISVDFFLFNKYGIQIKSGWYVVIIIILSCNFLLFLSEKRLKKIENKFKNVNQKINRYADIMIAIYMFSTPILLILAFYSRK